MSQKPPVIHGIDAKGDAPSPTPERPWCCPRCGSDRLTVYYTEHRASSVGSDFDQDVPFPDYARDVLIEMEPALFVFTCDACRARAIDPVRAEVRL